VCEREREIVRLPSSPLSLLLWDRTAAAGVVVSGKVVTGELKGLGRSLEAQRYMSFIA
jgi:hypothetical protein